MALDPKLVAKYELAINGKRVVTKDKAFVDERADTTLAIHFHELTPEEQGYLCGILNETNYKNTVIHRGLLPMVPLQAVIQAMAGNRGRYHGHLLSKLRSWHVNEIGFIMHLHDAKVAKRFGSHPERGVRLPGVQLTAEAGIKWGEFAKKYKPNPITVSPSFALRCIGKGRWRVSVAAKYRAAVEEYLISNCQ